MDHLAFCRLFEIFLRSHPHGILALPVALVYFATASIIVLYLDVYPASTDFAEVVFGSKATTQCHRQSTTTRARLIL